MKKYIPITELDCNKFNYNEITGELTWAVRSANRVYIGDIAGTVTPHGYRIVSMGGIGSVMAHRIIYTKVYGIQDWSLYEVDHIDGNRTNNSISNLRLVSRHINMKNKKIYDNNKTGMVGVYFNRKLQKWQGGVTHNGKKIHCGVFIDKQDCYNAVEAKRKELGFHANHGRQ